MRGIKEKHFEELRRKAEDILNNRFSDAEMVPEQDFQTLINEIQVYQVELEIQNEELRAAQKELERSRDRLFLLFHKAPVGYVTMDGAGIIVDANRTICELLACERQEMLQKPFSQFVAPEDQSVFFSKLKLFYKKPGSRNLEIRLVRKQGVAFHARLEGRLLSSGSDSEEPLSGQLLLIITDITELKKGEQRLKASLADATEKANENEALLACSKAVLEYSDFNKAARVIFNTAKKLIGATAGYVALLSADGEENELLFLDAGGRSCTVDPSLPMPVRGLRAESYQRNDVVYENRFMASEWLQFMPEGHVDLDNVMFAPLVLEGHSLGLIGLANKPGGFTPHDAKMAAAFGEFAAIALRNTRLLESLKASEEKVKNARKMEAIVTLTGGIAHEFNNLLSIVIGNTELALDEVFTDSPTQQFLKEIYTASHRGKDIVRQLMSFAHPGERLKSLIDIRAAVNKAANAVARHLPETVELLLSKAGECDVIEGDPAQIHQVVHNLCSNALHAMENFGGKLTIAAENRVLAKPLQTLDAELGPGGYVCLSVTDTGTGIDPANAIRVFDPFFTTKEVGKGSGMGLAVVHGIMKAHGGAVRITSESGNGTVVECYFPAVRSDSVTGRSSNASASDPSRILYLDDDEAVVKVAKMRLERSGYQVEARTDPSEAIEIFEADPQAFDLVITDLAMPAMGGNRVIRRLRSIRPDIKIVVCTGYNEELDSERIAQAEADGLLFKPHAKEELIGMIQQVLGRDWSGNSEE